MPRRAKPGERQTELSAVPRQVKRVARQPETRVAQRRELPVLRRWERQGVPQLGSRVVPWWDRRVLSASAAEEWPHRLAGAGVAERHFQAVASGVARWESML